MNTPANEDAPGSAALATVSDDLGIQVKISQRYSREKLDGLRKVVFIPSVRLLEVRPEDTS